MQSKAVGKAFVAVLMMLAVLALASASAFASPVDSEPSAGIQAGAPSEQVGNELEAAASVPDGPGGALDLTRYNKNMDIWFMLMLVAFLMMFIRKFEWGVCLATLLVAASSYVVYLLGQQFVFGVPQAQVFSQDVMIAGVACAITVVIGIGMFLGTVKMWQYILAGVLFTPAYMLLEWVLTDGVAAMFSGGAITDLGCGISVHLFAAYWGMGVILGIREKRAFDEPMYTTKHSVAFVWLAAMLLFVLWPSFVTALAPEALITSVMANCYMSGFGAFITAYIVSVICSKKVNALVYCYAMLAGNVASSSTLGLANVSPWMSLLIGALAGVICTLSFTYLHGWLCEKLGALDVMGVHNLHGVGGWISLITGAIAIGSVINIVAGVLTLALGLAAGLITGLILKATRGDMQYLMNDANDFDGENPHPTLEPPAYES